MNFPIVLFRTLVMKIKFIDDLEENLRSNLHCQHAYVCKIVASGFIRLFVIHNRTFRDGWTYERTSTLPGKVAPFHSIETI